jgi:NADH-quinone oxidoreductase subunit H
MDAPTWLTAQTIVSAVTIIAVVHIILVMVAYLIYFERKISAYIQDRIGPNRVGFDFGLPQLKFLRGMLGLGQPLADGLKFLLKEDYMPNRVDKVLFTLAPAIIIVPALIGFIVIPWGGVWNCPTFTIPGLGWTIEGGPVHVTGAHVNIGIVYLLAVASLGVYGVTLGGYASNNKYSFLGGLRATAQMISYEIPLGLALLAVLLQLGTVLPEGIIRHQAESGWLVFSQPLACLIFFIAIMAEANRAPFDNAEAEQELVGGYHTEYSSMRFALFFLAEYAHMVTSSAFLVLLFFGGYTMSFLPFVPEIPLLSPEATGLLAVLAKMGVFLFKILLVICFMMVIRWTIPRLRYDQIMTSAWQMVIPIAMLLIVAISVLVYLGQTGPLPVLVANLVVGAVAIALAPTLSFGTANKRIPLYGSRFSPVAGERVITRPTERIALEDRPVEGTRA